jgi:16S rRNA (cytosine967-C5)-methyltransferase
VAGFLADHPDFAAVPVAAAWAENLPTPFPSNASSGDSLRLTPARQRTDGFFVAVLERKA